MQLLCADSPADIRERYHRSRGLTRRRLDHLIWISRHLPELAAYRLTTLRVVPEGLVRPMHRPDENSYPGLAWLLTGEQQFADSARASLLELAATIGPRETGDWTQMHTWCDAFPVARWLVLLDWVWETLSEADQSLLSERLLYYLWAHPHQRMKARPAAYTPCNNQNGAMAFACAVGGYLFGIKRGDDPLARELLAAGFPHLVKFVTAFPAGGYSYEGSTYMAGVNALLLPLALELAKAVTGEDLLDCRESDACASPREVLQAIMHLSSPAGLLHPWDSYGYIRADFTAPAAYLAYRTGDRGALDFLGRIGALEEPAHLGWGFDKSLWTLLWLMQAEDSDDRAPAQWSFNYAEPSLAASASGPRSRLFALQMWDRSHWPPGRAQFNPNSLVLEYDGSPLLLDGSCVEGAKAQLFAAPEYRIRRGDLGTEVSIGGGTVGAHNCIFFDDEPHYAAPVASEGRLTGVCFQPTAALFEADVTACYRHRYDVTLVRRATLVLRDDLILVRDRIVSETPHAVTWRAHLRDGHATCCDHRFNVTTAEQTRLELCAASGIALEHRHFSGDAELHAQLESSCHEVSYTVTGDDLTLYTLISVDAGSAPWPAEQLAWELVVAEDEHEVDALRANWPGGEPVGATDSWFYTSVRDRPGIGIYRAELDIAEALPERLWLRLPRLTRSARILVNGDEYGVDLAPEEIPLVPHFVAVGSSLRPGRNRLEIISASTLETALHGGVLLLASVPSPAAAALTVAGESVTIEHHGRRDTIAWRDQGCVIVADDGAEIDLQLGSPAVAGSVRSALTVAEIDDRLRARLQACGPGEPVAAKTLCAEIAGDDWRRSLRALELAVGRTEPSLVTAAWQLLQAEARRHPTLPVREPDDVCWYRLKAAAAQVLGAARYEAATELLGTLLTGPDIYPVRVACAWALGRIHTPQARAFLAAVPENDEANTVVTARQALGG